MGPVSRGFRSKVKYVLIFSTMVLYHALDLFSLRFSIYYIIRFAQRDHSQIMSALGVGGLKYIEVGVG